MRVVAALVVSTMTLTASGCGPNTERALLTRFFSASRLRDLTALQKIATVVFEPARDGIITSFDIVQMTAVQGPNGQPVSEGVTISAQVRLPDGRTVPKKLVVTMEYRPPAGDRDPSHGWRITAFSERPEPASTPRS